MKKKGTFIVIEGGDGAGKATQLELLKNAFDGLKLKTTTFDFPRYEAFFGALVGRALKGDFGDFLTLSPYIASMPFTLDRASAREDLLKALTKGHILSNRYTPSNVVYQAAKIDSEKGRKEFIESLEKGEYEVMKLPKPSLVIYLQVPADISAKLITEKAARNYLGKEKGVKDLYEQNLEFQKKVTALYLALAKKRSDWKVINCAPKAKILSREEIHKKVLALVEKHLEK